MICLHKNQTTDFGLFIAPHAGGYPEQYFFLIKKYLDKFSIYSVRYPRDRVNEYKTFDQFVEMLATQLAATNVKRWVFLGVSLGGYLSYLLVHRLQHSKVCIIESLILVSVNNPVSLVEELKTDFSKDQMINKIIEGSNIPKSLIDCMEVKETIDGDLSFYQTSTKLTSKKINLPITTLFGTKDIFVNMNDSLRFWGGRTSEKVECFTYKGGHITTSDIEKKSLLSVLEPVIMKIFENTEVEGILSG